MSTLTYPDFNASQHPKRFSFRPTAFLVVLLLMFFIGFVPVYVYSTIVKELAGGTTVVEAYNALDVSGTAEVYGNSISYVLNCVPDPNDSSGSKYTFWIELRVNDFFNRFDGEFFDYGGDICIPDLSTDELFNKFVEKLTNSVKVPDAMARYEELYKNGVRAVIKLIVEAIRLASIT